MECRGPIANVQVQSRAICCRLLELSVSIMDCRIRRAMRVYEHTSFAEPAAANDDVARQGEGEYGGQQSHDECRPGLVTMKTVRRSKLAVPKLTRTSIQIRCVWYVSVLLHEMSRQGRK